MTGEKPLAERLAVCSWSLHPADPAELISQLGELEIPRVQLALDPLWRDDAWADAGARLADAGIEIVSGMFGCEGEDYSTLESIRRTGGIVPDETWPANRRNIERAAEIAESLGIALVTFHAGFLPEAPSDPSYDTLVGRMAELAGLFAARGIDLALETGQEDAETLDRFLDRLDVPSVGVNFDPANMILYGKGDPVAAAQRLMGWIRHLHVKDATAASAPGEWGVEVPVGAGAVDFPALLGALDEGNFVGPLAIEREAGENRIGDIRAAKDLVLSRGAGA